MAQAVELLAERAGRPRRGRRDRPPGHHQGPRPPRAARSCSSTSRPSPVSTASRSARRPAHRRLDHASSDWSATRWCASATRRSPRRRTRWPRRSSATWARWAATSARSRAAGTTARPRTASTARARAAGLPRLHRRQPLPLDLRLHAGRRTGPARRPARRTSEIPEYLERLRAGDLDGGRPAAARAQPAAGHHRARVPAHLRAATATAACSTRPCRCASVERHLGDHVLDARRSCSPPAADDAAERSRWSAPGPAVCPPRTTCGARPRGHRVRALPEPGGMLRYGIPAYRLPRGGRRPHRRGAGGDRDRVPLRRRDRRGRSELESLRALRRACSSPAARGACRASASRARTSSPAGSTFLPRSPRGAAARAARARHRRRQRGHGRGRDRPAPRRRAGHRGVPGDAAMRCRRCSRRWSRRWPKASSCCPRAGPRALLRTASGGGSRAGALHLGVRRECASRRRSTRATCRWSRPTRSSSRSASGSTTRRWPRPGCRSRRRGWPSTPGPRPRPCPACSPAATWRPARPR